MEEVRFEEMGLLPEIVKAVKNMGFEEASPIQAKAIPVMRTGKDMIGQAQTGTGKTAAFGIPLLEKIEPKDRKLQAIVLCPTRELAIQVAEEIRSLAKYMHGIKVLPIYGGQEIVTQIRSLKSGAQLVIGTPGRVMDHMRYGIRVCSYTRWCNPSISLQGPRTGAQNKNGCEEPLCCNIWAGGEIISPVV